MRITVIHCLTTIGHAHLHLLEWNFTLWYSILMKMSIDYLHSTLFLIHTTHSVIFLLIYQSVLRSISRILDFIQVVNKILFFLLQVFTNFVRRATLVFRLLQKNLLIVDGRVVVHVVIESSIPWLTRFYRLFGVLSWLSHIIVIGKVVSSINPITTYEQRIPLSSLILLSYNTSLLRIHCRINITIFTYLPSTIYLH